ncbi:MAG TPA: methyltransferase domain-containing protein [Terriglobales bacterium]|jgi:ubiquinone/menaquinone biosynthesis C-methylase UbiE|nr:methyltransferase domain-containing protein [Terriglobales bacterium]
MFNNAEAYELNMGRWSRRLAPLFVEFAEVKDGERILDVGGRTGSLSLALAGATTNAEIVGIDRSGAFVEYARRRGADARLRFEIATALELPFRDSCFDKSLALLVMQLIPDALSAARERYRVTRPGGVAAARTWDSREGRISFAFFGTQQRRSTCLPNLCGKPTDPTVTRKIFKPSGRPPGLKTLR